MGTQIPPASAALGVGMTMNMPPDQKMKGRTAGFSEHSPNSFEPQRSHETPRRAPSEAFSSA